MWRSYSLLGMLLVVGGVGCGTSPTESPTSVGRAVESTARNAARPNDDQRRTLRASWLNEETLRSLIDENAETARSVWAAAYHGQRRMNRWPMVLSRNCCRFLETHGADAEIPPRFLEEYQTFVEQHVPEIHQIVRLVDWNEHDFARILAACQWDERPTSIQVRLAQEDLWAYESILRTMAQVNQEVHATSNANAAVRRIDALEIGVPAAKAMAAAKKELTLRFYFGNLSGPWGLAPGEARERESAIGDEDESAVDSLDVDETAEALLTSRYVDLADDPLPSDSCPYPEFNLLPVHVVAVIDHPQLPSWLNRLAASEMPVEVMYVGVRESEPKETSLSQPVRRPTYVRVEILGVVRVFNPPEESV